MNYWHLQLHPGEFNNWDIEDIKKILEEGLIGCSGDPVSDFNKIQPGDIVLIRHGGTIIALVKVTSKPFDLDSHLKNEHLWFDRACNVEVLEYYKNEKVSGSGWFLPKTLLSVSNDTAYNYINSKYFAFLNNQFMEEIKSILKYKKQIILQGPPGTGKTKLAKELAKDLTTSTKSVNAVYSIKTFLKNFNPTTEIAKRENDLKNKLLAQFHEMFPKEKLVELTEETYAIGTGTNSSFCWWIERGLRPLGYYFPGSARSYLLYYKKEISDYSLHGKFSRQAINTHDAMTKIAGLISDLVIKKNFATAKEYFGDGFLLKLLHSYYPDEYFPVNSVPCMENILKLFAVQSLGLNALEMNERIQAIFNELKNETGSQATNHNFMQFLFDHFNIKGKIEVDKNDVINKGDYKLIQFHPSYSYEDFVRGITIELEDGQPNYIVKNKILASYAEQALNNPRSNYVLIIDEINRANLSSVLGELIYALEYRYDQENPRETSVESTYALKSDNDQEEEGRLLRLPSNLYIIGTMNTADRSVGHMDYAIRRRFAFVDVLPKDLSSELGDRFHKKLFNQVESLFHSSLSPEFDIKDVQLGHSYFIDKSEEGGSMGVRLKFEIKPILLEYIKDGILIGDEIVQKVDALKIL